MAYPAERKEFDPHFLGKAQKKLLFILSYGFLFHINKAIIIERTTSNITPVFVGIKLIAKNENKDIHKATFDFDSIKIHLASMKYNT